MNDARVVLRPVGNPLPLAFLSLGAGTLTLSAMQLGWVPAADGKEVALVLIGFVFPLQLLATVFAFLARGGDGHPVESDPAAAIEREPGVRPLL